MRSSRCVFIWIIAVALWSEASGAQDGGVSDNRTPYRTLAEQALTAFKAGDLAGAKKKAHELERSWDGGGKKELGNNAALWKSIDAAMDAFIESLQQPSPDAARVQAAFNDFLGKLKLAVKP